MQATEAAPAGRPGSRRRGRSGSAKVGEPGRAAEREQGRRGGHQGRGRGARGALGGAGRGGSCRAAREPGLSGSDSEMDRITPFAGQRFVLLALGPAAAAAAAAVRAGAGEFRDRSQGETRDRGIALSAHYLDRLFRLIVTSFICLSFKAGFPMRGKTVSEARLTLWVRDGGVGPRARSAAVCGRARVFAWASCRISTGVHCSPEPLGLQRCTRRLGGSG